MKHFRRILTCIIAAAIVFGGAAGIFGPGGSGRRASAAPGIVAGVERERPLSLLDLTPTMAALLGVDPHPDWRGQAVTELLPAPLPAREPVH